MKTLSLELNEISFEMLSKYFESGSLPNLKSLVEKHGWVETQAERRYVELEPWIQWVTAHTGLSLAEHNVFRLGDIVGKGHRQIWDVLQHDYGISSVAISPMNAENKISAPSIFIPDPWTATPVTGSLLVRWLYDAIRQLVNDNSAGKFEVRSFFKLIFGALFSVRLSSGSVLLSLLLGLRSSPWNKAIILDVLLANLLVRSLKNSKHGFASLFLNAGAHIQHHYWYSSEYYEGGQKNPSWYHSGGGDPVFDVYKAYDWIVGFVMRELPEWRLILSTGLSQLPNRKNLYYYRPYNHYEFLQKIIKSHDFRVSPRMSRDFLVEPIKARDLSDLVSVLEDVVVVPGNAKLLYVDSRDGSLFCQVAYTEPLVGNEKIYLNDEFLCDFSDVLVHVSIENAIHCSIGYLIDTGVQRSQIEKERVELKSVYSYMISAAVGKNSPA